MAFKFFKKTASVSTGFDLSPGGYSTASLSKENNRLVLENFSYSLFAEDVFQNGIILKPDVFAEGLKKSFEETEFAPKTASVCVSSKDAFIKTVSLPNVPTEELRIIAPQEVSKHIPFSANEINFDFQVLEHTKKGGRVDVIICALSKAIARNLVESFEKAGVEVVSIDVSTFAMLRALANAELINKPHTAYASVLIGYENTDVNIIRDGMPIFAHNTNIGRKNVLEAIMKGFELNKNEASQKLPELGIVLPGMEGSSNVDYNKASNITRTFYSTIASEIQKTIEFYYSQEGENAQIESVYLGGTGVCINNIDKYISNKLKMPVELCDSLANISHHFGKTDNLISPINIPSLAASIGAALKGFEN